MLTSLTDDGLDEVYSKFKAAPFEYAGKLIKKWVIIPVKDKKALKAVMLYARISCEAARTKAI